MIPSLLQIPSAVSDSKLHSVLPNNGKGDFQFERSTGATRINREGLIEEVGYFSSELVQNGNFSELGSELVTNGNFAADSNWNKTGTWQISNGQALGNGNGTTQYLSQDVGIVNGKTYKITYTVLSNSLSNDRFLMSGTSAFTSTQISSAIGENTVYLTAVTSSPSSGYDIRFAISSTNTSGSISIDNISVKQVDPNDRWTLGTGTTISDSKANFSSATSVSLYQDTGITSGFIKVTFSLTDYTSGTLKIYIGGYSIGTSLISATSVGSYSAIIDTSSGNGNVIFGSSDNFTGSINNVSVVEVQGDRPRLSYDITSGVVEDTPHLLLEPSSTNLVTFSEDFSQSAWVKENSSVITNQVTSPDGGLNANKIIENNQNSFHLCNHTISTSSSANYVWSVFVKKGTRTNAYIYFRTNSNSTRYGFNINLENGLITDTESFGSVTNIETNVFYYGNDWYRCSIRMGNTSGSITGIVAPNNNSTTNGINNDYQGDGTSYIYAWGAQVEVQSYATSYIKTAGTIISRGSETCNNSKPSVNSTEGVLYCEASTLINGADCRITLSDGSISNRVSVEWDALANTIKGFMGSNGNVQTSSFNQTQYLKIALHYKVNDFKMFINGANIAQDTNVSVQVGLNTLSFDNATGTNDFYGKVKGVAVYNEALSESQLMQLTGVTASSIYNNFVTRTASFTVEALNEVKKVIDNL